jgi:hypothetical protein
MKYFFVILNSFENYDDKTSYNENFAAHNYGLQFSNFPIDDFMIFDNKYFITERVYYTLFDNSTTTSKLSGTKKVGYVRIEKNSNWNNTFPTIEPEKYIEILITGESFKDDFGIYKKETFHEVLGYIVSEFLIVSELGVKSLVMNHSPNILGCEISIIDCQEIDKINEEIIYNQDKFKIINQIGNF